MIKTAVAISALLVAGSLGVAMAQEQTTTPGVSGTIQTVDPTGRTVTLDDGQTYTFGADADMSTFQAGSMVDLSCDAGNANCTAQTPGTTGNAAETSNPEEQTQPSAGDAATGGAVPEAGTDASGSSTESETSN
jgi:hypothetical protein